MARLNLSGRSTGDSPSWEGSDHARRPGRDSSNTVFGVRVNEWRVPLDFRYAPASGNGEVSVPAYASSAVLPGAFLQFGASIPLGIYTAPIVSRLQFLGLRTAGVHIALFGGLSASVFLAVSALIQWALGQDGIAVSGGAHVGDELRRLVDVALTVERRQQILA